MLSSLKDAVDAIVLTVSNWKPIHFVIKLSRKPGELQWPEGTHVRDHVKALAVISRQGY